MRLSKFKTGDLSYYLLADFACCFKYIKMTWALAVDEDVV